MPYCWTIAGVVHERIPISEDRFVGLPQRSHLGPSGAPPFRVFGERLPFRDGLTLCTANVFTRPALATDARISASGAVIYAGDEIVASTTNKWLFVHPLFRKRGLAAEVIAEHLAYDRSILRWRSTCANYIRPFTTEGVRAARAAYRLLHDRGLVCDP
jgi:hypothetical protein